MTKSFEPAGERKFFDVSFMTAKAVASVNLKRGATLLQHPAWKVSQPRAGEAGAGYAARLVARRLILLDTFISQHTH